MNTHGAIMLIMNFATIMIGSALTGKGGMTMPDREKVIKDLEECMTASCRGYRPRLSCPYNDEEWDIMRDALELLKEQPEIVRCKDCKAWKQYDDMNLGECELYPEYNKMGDWFCNFGERKEGR